MAKNKPAAKTVKPVQRKEKSSVSIIPEKYQSLVYIFISILLIVIFFNSGIFGNKVFSSADNIASASFDTFIKDANKSGTFALWMPYIFCGMPSFAALITSQERMYDVTYAVWGTVRNILYGIRGDNPVWGVVLFYMIFAVGFYFLALYKFKNRLIALYCAVAAVFITPVIQFIIVGHNTKMIAIMMFPAIFLFVEKIKDYFLQDDTTKDKESIFRFLLYFSALVFFIHIQMSSNHIQMLFYFNFALGIYLLYILITALIKKENWKPFAKTAGVFLLATGISALMYADYYLSIKEYNKYSIRGVPAITSELPENKGKPNEPLDYEYATNWSFSPGEVMTLIIPYWQGFGDVEYKGQKMNTYWGQMPFTTSPVYFGVLTLFLAFIGIVYNFRKNRLVQALCLIIFLSLLLSFGRTFPVLYDLFFYHFPYFSSWRAPSMILILIDVSMVILAGLGIKTIIDMPNDKTRSTNLISRAKYIFPVLAFPILISFIGFEGSYNSMVTSSPLVQKLQQQGANPQQMQQYLNQIATIAYDNVKSEMLVVGFLLLLLFGCIYLYLKNKMKMQMLLGAIILLTVIDLWHIDFKTLHWDNKSENENTFKTPDYVDWILKNEKNTYDFRVLDLNNGQPVRENTLAYWRLQNVYGYQGAKMRIFQDLDDVAGLTNNLVWGLTSTKYIISDKPYSDSTISIAFKGSKYVLLNKNYLPKAFFISSYKTATGIEILNNIKDGKFNPRQIAYFEKEPNLKIDKPDSTAKVQITEYSLHNIILNADASGNNLMFFSESYYPAGWKAFIDGQPTDIYKTDYLFRSIVVPKGSHKIEFRFEPEAYYTGKKISVAGNVILILIFVTAIGGIFMKKKKVKDEIEAKRNSQ